MADDFLQNRYQTQRLNRDITQDLAALETPTEDNKEDDDPFADPSTADAGFEKKAELDPLLEGQSTLEDLLNGYVINPAALQAVDECLYVMSVEWDTSDILTKDIIDCDKLLNNKCFKSHKILLKYIIDPTNIMYNQLLRLTRKMKAVNLVIGNQKMVHIPHNAEQLESILDKLSGVSGIISIKTNRRTLDRVVTTINDENDDDPVDVKDPDGGGDDQSDNDIDVPQPNSPASLSSPAMSQPNLFDVSRDLESLIFTNRMLYKDTSIAKKRDKQRVSTIIPGLNMKKASVKIAPLSKPKDTNLVKIEEQIENNAADKGKNDNQGKDIEMVVDDNSKPKNRDAHHVKGVKCEGCGNAINLADCYETAITYKVPILPNKLFYFHDSFCATLRRLKESIRRFVMRQSLPPARHATTSVGYVRNLLANFNTLITTLGELPRPNPFSDSNSSFASSLHLKKAASKQYLQQMSLIRSSVHKLILRQDAINNRDAKNFADEYDWKFKDIPQSIQYCNMSIYGSSLAEYVIQQLLSKQLDALWLTLAFIAQGMDATSALQLLDDHRTSLAKVKEMEHLDLVLMSMIESSNYTIAMALYLSAWMLENAEQDLSRAEDFETVGEKYIRIASSLVASVESDHLLSLLLEAPTDIAHLSVFEIAIKYGLHNFMDDSRVQMLMAHMWSEFDFLNPQKSFRTSDITLYELLGRLMWKPNTFYYCPVGRYWTESVMYITYVFIVSGVVFQKNYHLSSSLSGLEIIMWIFNLGFILGELIQMLFEGVAYLTEAGNMFDILIMVNWALLAMLRFGCASVFSGSDQCNYVGSTSTGNRAEEGDKNAVLTYMAIFCFQICVLWGRCALIFSTQRSVGPFISMIPGMVKDILNWTFVLGIFYMGFCFGTNFIIDADISSDEEGCGAEGDMDGLSLVFEYNFILLMGQSEWGLLNTNNCLGPNRSLVLKIYMWTFSVIGTVLLLNLLIAMMASTYEQIREGTTKQVNFARAEQTFSLSHRNAIIPPPLNVVAFLFAILWWFLEFLVWLLSLSGYIMNVEKLVPVYIDYDRDFAEFENRNQRNLDKTSLRCCGLFQKLKNPSELFKIKIAKHWSSTARYCQFCRCYMRIPGNISHYFELFIKYRLDEADVQFMKSLMEPAGICPQCYRAYRKYDGDNKTNRLYRWQVILEVLSFYVFIICIWVPLIILIALPALFNGLFSLMEDIISATKIVESGPMIIKDDKYVQLVEDIMDEESNTDSDVLGAQVAHLNRKLIQIKQTQSATSNVLAEQSIHLEEHGKILKAMVPYIRKIDVKMDKSITSNKVLHQQQISIFTTEMKEQSGLIQASRGVLDAHTGYNKQHQEELEQQRLIAKKHQEEMEFFKKELENLRKLKQQQQDQQQILEQQQKDQISAFSKELKQQRVLREMEIDKQQKMNKKQNEELKLKHQNQLTTLQKQIDRQQFLRSIEDKKHKEERQKREILALRQQQDMQTLTIQMEQIRKMQEIEKKKKEIEEQERRQKEKKMKDIENEILSLKKIKDEQKNIQNQNDLLRVQQSKRIEHLQSTLMLMKAERQKANQNTKLNLELNELKLIQQKSKEQTLKDQIESLAKKQKQNNLNDIIAQRNHEKHQMQHLIAMEKLHKSATVLQLNISGSYDDADDDDNKDDNKDDAKNDDDNDDNKLVVDDNKNDGDNDGNDDDNDDNGYNDYDNADDDDRNAP